MKNKLPDVPSPPLYGLGPVISSETHTLILCSYPGKEALKKQEYYAGRQNQFWAIMSAVLKETLTEKTYNARLSTLLSHGIGLWDVVSASQNQGSIKSLLSQKNKSAHFLKNAYPHIQKICFNGQPAAEYAPLFQKAGYLILTLPSSSPMYSRQSLDQKIKIWQETLGNS